ncbi:MAG: hypothetical protein ACXW32_02630, partial [Limisphaerales bacterium]
MRILVAMILVAVWPAVTSHYLLESLGIIHVAHHETDLTAKNALEHHHQHPHHGEGPSHQDQQHHHQDTGGEGETSADHHIFADGDYAWISAGKALTKPELLVCCSLSLFCASSLSAIEDDLDSPGPAPPGAAPPLLQKT